MPNLIIIYKYLQHRRSICKKKSLFRGNCQQQTLPILATYLTNFNKVNILHLFTFYIPKKSTNTAQILQILHICATAINYLDWVNKQNLGCTCHRRHHCCDEKKIIVVTHGRVSVCFRRISHCTEKLHSARDFFPPPVFQAFVTRSKVVCDKHKGWQAQRGTKGAAAFVHLPSVLILPTELHFMAERLRPIFRFFSVKPPCQYIYSRFSLDFWALEFILTAIVEFYWTLQHILKITTDQLPSFSSYIFRLACSGRMKCLLFLVFCPKKHMRLSQLFWSNTKIQNILGLSSASSFALSATLESDLELGAGRRIDERTVYGTGKVMDTGEKHSLWMFQRFSYKYIYDIQSGHVQKKNGHISSSRLQIKNISKVFLIFSGSGSCCILSGSHCPPNPLNFCSLWKPHLLIV